MSYALQVERQDPLPTTRKPWVAQEPGRVEEWAKR